MAGYICKSSPYACFPWMVVMNHLLPESLVHIVERDDIHSRKEAAVAVFRQRRCHYIYYQVLSLACNCSPAFDLSFHQPCLCKGAVLYTPISWCNKSCLVSSWQFSSSGVSI